MIVAVLRHSFSGYASSEPRAGAGLIAPRPDIRAANGPQAAPPPKPAHVIVEANFPCSSLSGIMLNGSFLHVNVFS